MEYRQIPNSHLKISNFVLGTWAMGGDMWGGTNEKLAVEAIAFAAERGINTIDTAPIYGDGLAETIIGKAIKGQRDRWILATKCGLIKQGKRVSVCLRPESVILEAEASLRRLGTDAIDIYQCHWPDAQTPVEATMEAMARLKSQGKIKAVGLSNFDVPLIKKASALTGISVLQNQYSLLERTIEKDLLLFAQERGLAVVTYGALAGGILTGKYQEPPHFPRGDARSFFYKYYHGEIFQAIHSRCRGLSNESHPPHEIALNWVRRHPGVTAVIIGCRNARQVEMNLRAFDWAMSADSAKTIGALFEGVAA